MRTEITDEMIKAGTEALMLYEMRVDSFELVRLIYLAMAASVPGGRHQAPEYKAVSSNVVPMKPKK